MEITLEIISRYSGLKTRARETRDYLKQLHRDTPTDSPSGRAESQLLSKASTGLSECANYLVFHDYYTIEERKLVKTKTCKQGLLCPFCAARRAAKNVKAYGDKVSSLMSERSELFPVMITFTVKNQSDLNRVYAHMNKSLKRLMDRRRSNKCHGSHETEMKKVVGAIASREVTYNQDSNEWHPHIHMVALLSDYIDQKKLSEEWFDITGDSKIVSVNLIKQKTQKKPINTDQSPLTDGLLEVFKYALKFGDLPQDKLWEAYKILKGKRMVSSYGDLYGVQVPEALTDDPYDDLPYVEMFYLYGKKSKSYELKTCTKYDSRVDQEKDISQIIQSFDPIDQRPSIGEMAHVPIKSVVPLDVFGRVNSTRKTRVKIRRCLQSV